jgi:hypothetical protein
MTDRLVSVALLLGLLIAPVASAAAMQCPAPQPMNGPGVLKETPAQVERVSHLLATGDDDNRIHTIVNDLRDRYPNVQNVEIINYLVTAYCPIVNHLNGLGDAQKQARMDRFVGQVTRIVY